jgi:type II secretory pathway component PulC
MMKQYSLETMILVLLAAMLWFQSNQMMTAIHSLSQRVESMENRLHIQKIDTKEYTYKDFVSKFNVVPVFDIEMNDEVRRLVENNDITKEAKYQEVQADLKLLNDKMVHFIENNPRENDDRVVVRYSGPKTGYGLFAKKPLKAGDILGVFAGELNDSDNTDYMWVYPTITEKDGREWEFGMDGRLRGNYLRFVNHNEQKQNCDVMLC